MYRYTLAALAFLGAVNAQNSTVNLALLNIDQQPIDASIVGSDADATTYVLSCPTGTDPLDCGIPDSFTVTQGPSTLHFASTENSNDLLGTGTGRTSLPFEESFTASFDYACKIIDSSSADCTLTASESVNGTSTTTVDSTTITDASDLGYVSVTVTAGTTGSQGASATGSSSSKSGSKSSSSKSGSSSTASGTAGGEATSNPAMPAITAKAQWALGGAAAALAYAAM